MRYIIDCDPGHDDTVAILLAASVLKVSGITTVYGNAPVSATTRNALDFLALAGLDIPVFRGSEKPLKRSRTAANVHGRSGLDGADLPSSQQQVEEIDAIEFIARLAREPKSLTVIATGPLTNLARALQRFSHVEAGIASLSIMGATAGRSNTTAEAEFNAYSDPEALETLLASTIPMSVVGYDITSQVGLSDNQIARLENSGRRVGEFIGKVMRLYRSRQLVVTGLDIAPQHDACAVLPFLAPGLATYEEVRAAVELEGALTTGMVVFERRSAEMQRSLPSPFSGRRPIRLCTALLRDDFVETILKAVLAYP